MFPRQRGRGEATANPRTGLIVRRSGEVAGAYVSSTEQHTLRYGKPR